MRVLVTGGAGFIGSHYVRTMLSGGYPGFEDAEVTVFDKLTYAGNLANLAPVADSPRYRFVRGDICSAEDLDAALPGHDVVVHFAAESHVDRSISGAAGFVVTNVVGTQQVLEAAVRHGVRRVRARVHRRGVRLDRRGLVDRGLPAGAQLAVLGVQGRQRPARPRLRARPTGWTCRPPAARNNYGPYHFPEKVIPLFVTNLLDGHKVPLYGEGANVRDWLFVDDHCRGIQLVLEKGAPRRGLQHRRRPGAVEQGAHREAARGHRPRLGLRGEHRRPARRRPRPALLGGQLQDRRARLRPAGAVRAGPGPTVQWYRDNRAWWEPLKAAAATALS